MTLSTDDDAVTLTRRDGDMVSTPTGSIAFRDEQEAMDVALAILDALDDPGPFSSAFSGYDLSLHG